jgi:hypothetical protein
MVGKYRLALASCLSQDFREVSECFCGCFGCGQFWHEIYRYLESVDGTAAGAQNSCKNKHFMRYIQRMQITSFESYAIQRCSSILHLIWTLNLSFHQRCASSQPCSYTPHLPPRSNSPQAAYTSADVRTSVEPCLPKCKSRG